VLARICATVDFPAPGGPVTTTSEPMPAIVLANDRVPGRRPGVRGGLLGGGSRPAQLGALTDPVEAWLRCGPVARRPHHRRRPPVVEEGQLSVPTGTDFTDISTAAVSGLS
jgi:hypothetical protein